MRSALSRGAQGHDSLHDCAARCEIRSLARRPPIRYWPDGVGPGRATPFPGSYAATGQVTVTGLSVASETGTLLPPIRTQSCATSTQPAGGMRRATLAGSAGIQITRRTARTYWEHRPRWVSRDDIEPSFPKSVSITSREGRMCWANPIVPRAHGALRPCGYGDWPPRREGAAPWIVSKSISFGPT